MPKKDKPKKETQDTKDIKGIKITQDDLKKLRENIRILDGEIRLKFKDKTLKINEEDDNK